MKIVVFTALVCSLLVWSTCAVAEESTASSPSTLAGPSSVQGQIGRDEEVKRGPGLSFPKIRLRERLEEDYGLVFAADYNVLPMYVSERPGGNTTVGGVVRLYGHWTPLHRDVSGAGRLVFKGEYRHKLGTSIAPKELDASVGIAGVTGVPFSDAGAVLTNFYWIQEFLDNRVGVGAGVVDVTDYVDVYGLMNPWTDFNDLAFSTSPTIPAPDQGLGFAGFWRFHPKLYVLGGLADANGDPHDPFGEFERFFAEHEYFEHLEVGWIGSWDNRFSDNVHVTAWHAGERHDAGIPDGWGVAFSANRLFRDRWVPFLRGGYADGGGAVLSAVVSAGVGYQLNELDDFVAFGASWGRPPKESTEGRTRDQYSFEAYYRIQILPQLALTPAVQFIEAPALNPAVDHLWIFALRLRVTL